ncbi:MAG: hypothetical protein J2P21_14035 [Chloracidobacterium sp.]|nr:hypothetical protein [Chloracidobacterium sp.]
MKRLAGFYVGSAGGIVRKTIMRFFHNHEGLFNMFCQQCGAKVPEESKFCWQCGNQFRTGFQISNKAMALAALAAVISVVTAFLPFASKSETKAQDGKAETAAITTPSPEIQKKVEQAQKAQAEMVKREPTTVDTQAKPTPEPALTANQNQRSDRGAGRGDQDSAHANPSAQPKPQPALEKRTVYVQAPPEPQAAQAAPPENGFRPRAQPLINGTYAVNPGQFLYFPINVGPLGLSRVRGSFMATGGTGNDIAVYIVDERGLDILRHGGETETIFNSGKKSRGPIIAEFPPLRAATYYLILDNRFSIISAKTVEVHSIIVNMEKPE